MTFDRTPNKKHFIPVGATKQFDMKYLSTGDSERLYRAFISDANKELLAGNQVLCFHKYQLDELVKIYKDELLVYRNAQFNWWECKLKNYKKFLSRGRGNRRTDVSTEEILLLKKKGLTRTQIATKLNCSFDTVNRRLKGEKSK